MKLNLSKQEKDQLIEEIKFFFAEERDEELGVIASERVLTFFLDQLGVILYNKGLDDARIWFTRRMEDLGIDYDLLYKS